MALSPGTRLGVYEILALLGAGGMGEVYKARDPRLGRTVAIKILPSELAEVERRQRFEREAQAIASLNHPHICVVHDVGQHAGIDFLVMELLEGETLADRIAKGPIAFDQLLTYAIQIGDALDKAHRHGVTHRDLKPGNIMLTKSGVKLLDFGLAKVQQAGLVPTQTIAATLTAAARPLTMQGAILGTLQYMSPEQLEGGEADARSDIFAFGALLYEMATGRRAFEGKSQVSLIAAILDHDPPPVSSLQNVTPQRFDDVIRICLAKNPDERWQNAADLVHELKLLGIPSSAATAAVKQISTRERFMWTAAVVVAVVVVMAATLVVRRPADPARASFEVQTNSPGNNAPFMITLSPDGKNLVARVTEGEIPRLWMRPIERVTGMTLRGTEGASYPFWSSDGRYVGFFADGKLKTVDILGAPPQSLADAPNARGGTWSRDGAILYAAGATGPLFRVAASGGQPVQVTELNKRRNETAHLFPCFLPDGDHFLYLAISSTANESAVYVGSLESKNVKRLVASATKVEFSAPDLLLFLRENTLMAQRLDVSRLGLSGDPFQVAEQVAWSGSTGAAGFTVSANGVLAFRTGGLSQGRQLVWVDRDGKNQGTVGTASLYENPRLSPDGKRLAVYRPTGEATSGSSTWTATTARASRSTRRPTTTPCGRPTDLASRSSLTGTVACSISTRRIPAALGRTNCY
jgi:eukaryotic-like serine/threonine-protein kinase